MQRIFAAALLVTALSIAAPTEAQAPITSPTPTCALHGRISDTLGAAIFRGYVEVHSDRWVKMNQVLTLNDNGEFSVQLMPGLYDFFIGSPGFIPYAREIDLRTCKPVELKIKLKVDLEHLED
jgi:hypothetical protein